MLVSGGLSIEDINKQMPKEIVAKLVADVAMSANSTVPFAASWISNGKLTGGQLTDAGVLLFRAECHQILAAYCDVLQRFHQPSWALAWWIGTSNANNAKRAGARSSSGGRDSYPASSLAYTTGNWPWAWQAWPMSNP